MSLDYEQVCYLVKLPNWKDYYDFDKWYTAVQRVEVIHRNLPNMTTCFDRNRGVFKL